MAQHKNSVYKRISEDISAKIKKGEYAKGAMLEPERKLMELYGVERTTVRRALDLLVNDGLVIKKSGLGTFVSDGKSVPNDKKTTAVKAVKKTFRTSLPEIINIRFDNTSAASEIFGYLLANGHEKVMCIMKNQAKFAAVCGEAVKLGVYDGDMFTLSGKNKADDVFVQLWRLLRSPKPTALIVENETDAKLVIATAERMRISVPDELSVIVFSKNASSDFAGCISDNSYEKKLIKMLENVPDEELCPVTVLVCVKFEEGNTACAVKKDTVGSGRMSSFLL